MGIDSNVSDVVVKAVVPVHPFLMTKNVLKEKIMLIMLFTVLVSEEEVIMTVFV